MFFKDQQKNEFAMPRPLLNDELWLKLGLSLFPALNCPAGSSKEIMKAIDRLSFGGKGTSDEAQSMLHCFNAIL